MKKDIIIAIVIGFIAGGLAAGSVIYLPAYLRSRQNISSDIKISPTPLQAIEENKITFDIVSPKDESLFTENKIQFNGIITAKQPRKIIVDTQEESKILESTPDGSFGGELTLLEGVNNIYFTLYNDSGEMETKFITVYYTDEKL